MGWRITGELPNIKKAVLIVAPHTSNKDGFITVCGMLALGLKLSFFVKHSAFRWPFAKLMLWFGAVPVNRDNATDVVKFSADQLNSEDKFWLAIAPEGTRHSAKSWKTGFYWIAHRAQVPVLMIAFDYRLREIKILGQIQPTGEFDREFSLLLNHYKSITPRHPERLSVPLKEL
jgi:1-acyl-sn-glycerol-3-phosphate acyltransferase